VDNLKKIRSMEKAFSKIRMDSTSNNKCEWISRMLPG
jgi:hypothetical protein